MYMHSSYISAIRTSPLRYVRKHRPTHILITASRYGSSFDNLHLSTYSSLSQKKHNLPTINSSDAHVFYRGPLSTTFKNLKLFSLTSLSLASALTPFIFIIDAPLSLSARIALAVTALGTSISSTALIAWCGKPYVVSMRRKSGSDAIELTTTNVFLREQYTTILDPRFLQPTSRPFATWELPESVTTDLDCSGKRVAGSAELIALTRDRLGNVVGKYTVEWSEKDGQLSGAVRKEGSPIRYVN
ncbi:hypothetical protein AG1IA_03899 [Rhizoctonia solani AG-1 IA]|uniref:Uncharacterized protein n=1 Tax=Thanatephorus cucumeris (strain AG1-IA) TaxID=983506 RepID=L8WVC2_THACA|nr:hypothetical protein AG1IA_03899 [Rhizoctonia solani AG-1 IA]